MKRALTIAGSDSAGGAGIQADLKTFGALGVFGMSAITALTAQNTVGVRAVYEIPPAFVRQQIEAVLDDVGADAVKTGMLSSAPIIEVVAETLRAYGVRKLVVDPVMVAKSGDVLLRHDAREALIRLLLPLALVVTPNVAEAQALTGINILDEADMREAARAIHALGAQNVVVKGGHVAEAGESADVLYDGHNFRVYRAARVRTSNTHGTGCTFASAIAANLARGVALAEAIERAKNYLTAVLRASITVRLGRGHGPMNHFAALQARPSDCSG